MIKKIEIENIKGFGAETNKKVLELNIIPNKPSLLVAPNGFGKSSFATAFKSMNNERIKLEKKDCHKEDESKHPLLKITFKNTDDTITELQATNNSNTISSTFDYFVINSPIKAKGVGQSFGGRTNISASISVDDIILIDRIPSNERLDYSFTESKVEFGSASKILLNITPLFSNNLLLIELIEPHVLTILNRIGNVTVQQKIEEFKSRLNLKSNLSKTQLNEIIRNEELEFLNTIPYLSTLANIIGKYDLPFSNKEVDKYIYALSLSKLYLSNKEKFKKFCIRKEYEQLKSDYTILFSELNTTWYEFKPKEKNNKLILEFPKAHMISNGQRDVICFMANLEKAKYKLKKENCILIIDEVFDYLDDANLVAVQYYTTQLIDKFKNENRYIYPLILTHLDPEYFKGYVFGRKHKLKTYYLLKSESSVNENLIKILRERNKQTSPLKNDIEKLLLHYHTEKINKRAEFLQAGLRQTWGEDSNFQSYIDQEVKKYIDGTSEFDPLAVCCGVRIRIEKNIYDQIQNTTHKLAFLETYTSGTSDKLEFAESIGVNVNESYSFLGLLYNESLHWNEGKDKNSNIAPAMAKLNNLTIRKLVQMVFSEQAPTMPASNS